jgi:hypothetical protein
VRKTKRHLERELRVAIEQLDLCAELIEALKSDRKRLKERLSVEVRNCLALQNERDELRAKLREQDGPAQAAAVAYHSAKAAYWKLEQARREAELEAMRHAPF